MFGKNLPLDASRDEALAFLRELVSDMTVAQFETLSEQQIYDLAQDEWRNRYLMTVITISKTDRTVIRLLIRGG